MAELKLGVSFDLVYFRQQLQKLSQMAAAEFNGKAKLSIDKRDFQRQFNALTKELKINVNDSQLIGARKNLTQLNQSLATFRRATSAPIEIKIKYTEQGKPPAGFGGTAARAVTGRVTGTQAIQTMSRGELQKVYGLFREANLAVASLSKGLAKSTNDEIRDALIPAFSDSGEEAVNGLANGLKDGSTKVSKAAARLGDDTLRAIKGVLGIASPSREFKKVGEDSGEGFEQGLKSGLGEAARMGVQEMRSLFRALQGEAQSGAARLQATMLAAMAGLVQLPGGRQQRGQLRQTGTGINAAMTGAALGNIQARQGAIRGASQSAAAATPSFLTALPLMFGMSERELTDRLSGLYGQQYQAPRMGGYTASRPGQVAQLIAQLTASGGGARAGTGALLRGPASSLVSPGVSPTGYIGRSALSAQYVNYAPGMPVAYGSGFMGAGAGRYAMSGQSIGAGGGSFVPMDAGRSIGRLEQSLIGLTQRVKTTADAVRRDLMPTFGDMRRGVMDVRRSVATSLGAQGGFMGSAYVNNRGGISYASSRFPTSGMATASAGGIVAGTSRGSMGRFPSAGMIYPSSPRGSMGMFPSAGMMGPSSPLGVVSAQSTMFRHVGGTLFGAGGGGGFGRFGGGFGGTGGFGGGPGGGSSAGVPGSHGLGQAMRSMQQGLQGAMSYMQTARVPLSGAINELAGEFGNAITQVLLFGTAYKALAFLTNLPRQALDAAKGLQTFVNQLRSVTEQNNTFERSFQFIDALAERFNTPLESARRGFIRMYAAMEPAGFGQQEIEKLFTGMSKAAAVFGMSTDEVDRMTNAFAQMASKGQLSAEEVKNQLGDVLPGALATFAEAAQMSIPEFLKAMEDGAFRGKAMQDVLNNVGAVLSNKFGPSAVNASKTLQGALNSISNSLLKMYEAFTPIVNELASVFGPQVSALIKDVTNVVKVLTGSFSDTSGAVETLSPRARALYDTIQQLIPRLQEAGRALVNLSQFFAGLVPVAIQLGSIFVQIASSNIGKAFIAISISVGILQTAFIGLTRNGVGPAIAALYRFIGVQLGSVLRVWHRQLIVMTRSMVGFTAATKASRLALIAFRAALTGLVVGGILLFLEGVGTAISKIGSNARKSAGEVRQLKQDLDQMAAARDVASIQERIDKAQRAETAALKVLNDLERQEPGAASLVGPVSSPLQKARQSYSQAVEERVDAQRALKNAQKLTAQDFNAATKQKLTPITPSPDGDGKGKGNAKAQRESQVPQLRLRLELARQLFAIDKQIATAQLSENTVLVSRLELTRKLTELEYDRRQVMLEAIPDDEKRLKIAELQYQKEEAILRSQLQLRLDLQKELSNTNKAIGSLLIGYREEAAFQERYYQLVLNGVNPALAQTTVEVERRFTEEAKSLQTQIEQLDVGIAELEIDIERAELAKTLSEVQKKELADAKERLEILRGEVTLRRQIKGELPAARSEAIAQSRAAAGPKPLGVIISEGYSQVKADLEGLANSANLVVSSANSIGDAFGKAFTDIATGVQTWRNGLASAFSSVASMFADMVAQMLAKWAAMQIIGMFLPSAGGGGGNQVASSFSMPSDAFIPSGGFKFANGGIANGGFHAFANGGLVNGPTLGLVGEGRFNEAVVPLPNGKSIPVDLGNGPGNNISTNIVVNMNNNQASSNVTGSGGQALGRELEGAVRNVILKESRPGGIIYGAR